MRRLNSYFAGLVALAMSLGAAPAAGQEPEVSTPGVCQGRLWSLEQCIQYALENNISVKQARAEADRSTIDLSSARRGRLPSLDAGVGGTMSFGRGADRDGVIRDRNTFSADASLSTSVPIFGGLQIAHAVRREKSNLQAALSDLDRAREDISLNVTSLYLQVLLDQELLGVAERQIVVARELVESNRLKYEAGKIAEADLVESRAQLARDEYTRVQRQSDLDLALLDLKQLLDLPADELFVVVTPDVSGAMLADLATLGGAQQTFDAVADRRPAIRAAQYRVRAAQAGVSAARAQFYPSLSARAGYSNGYYHSFAGGDVNPSFNDQINTNGSEYIGMSLNIPLFNRGLTRNQVRSAKVAASLSELGLRREQLAARKAIEQAYQSAASAWGQYAAASESATAAGKSFAYERERLDAGTSTLYNYDLARSRWLQAQSEMLGAKYEYLLRTKVIKFYEGSPLSF